MSSGAKVANTWGAPLSPSIDQNWPSENNLIKLFLRCISILFEKFSGSLVEVDDFPVLFRANPGANDLVEFLYFQFCNLQIQISC